MDENKNSTEADGTHLFDPRNVACAGTTTRHRVGICFGVAHLYYMPYREIVRGRQRSFSFACFLLGCPEYRELPVLVCTIPSPILEYGNSICDFLSVCLPSELDPT